jgi:hypothetical protein
MAEANLTPLELMFEAIKNHNSTLLLTCLRQGVPGDARRSMDYATGLHIAALHGSSTSICHFSNYNYMVHGQLLTGNSDALQILLGLRFAPNINAQKANGDCALKIAAERGHHNCVQVLLQARAVQPLNLNLRGVGGWNALMAACANNRTSCVRVLLDSPVLPDLDMFDFSGRTAFDLAPTDIIRELLRETVAKLTRLEAEEAQRRAKFEADQLENAVNDIERRSLRDHHARHHQQIASHKAEVVAERERFRARIVSGQVYDSTAAGQSAARITLVNALQAAVHTRDLQTIEKTLELDKGNHAWSASRSHWTKRAQSVVAALKLRKRKPIVEWTTEDIVLILNSYEPDDFNMPELLFSEFVQRVSRSSLCGSDLAPLVQDPVVLEDFVRPKYGELQPHHVSVLFFLSLCCCYLHPHFHHL